MSLLSEKDLLFIIISGRWKDMTKEMKWKKKKKEDFLHSFCVALPFISTRRSKKEK